MQDTFRVTFDGIAFHPETTDLKLEPNQQYVIKIVAQTLAEEKQPNAWDLLEEMAGTYPAPDDWSSEHDHYLYGVPKNNLNNEQK